MDLSFGVFQQPLGLVHTAELTGRKESMAATDMQHQPGNSGEMQRRQCSETLAEALHPNSPGSLPTALSLVHTVAPGMEMPAAP